MSSKSLTIFNDYHTMIESYVHYPKTYLLRVLENMIIVMPETKLQLKRMPKLLESIYTEFVNNDIAIFYNMNGRDHDRYILREQESDIFVIMDTCYTFKMKHIGSRINHGRTSFSQSRAFPVNWDVSVNTLNPIKLVKFVSTLHSLLNERERAFFGIYSGGKKLSFYDIFEKVITTRSSSIPESTNIKIDFIMFHDEAKYHTDDYIKLFVLYNKYILHLDDIEQLISISKKHPSVFGH